MDRLQEYLENEYLNEKKLLSTVDSTIKKSVNTLLDKYCKQHGWNYNISEPECNPQVSYSTTSMVSFALNIIAKKTKSLISPICSEKFSDQYIDSIEEFKEKQCNAANLFFDTDTVYKLTSKTYGTDNIFVLLWLLKNILCMEEVNYRRLASVIRKSRRLLNDIVGNISKPDKISFALEDNHIEPMHTFPMLKVIEMYKVLIDYQTTHKLSEASSEDEKEVDELINGIKDLFANNMLYIKDYFTKKMHYYLSLASIRDSNFDAAELVFSLEGLLLIENNNMFDENILHKVFAVLSEKQEINIYWRPLTPFIRRVAGMALLPLSVEIATSLLNICIYLQDKGDALFESYYEIFKKYTVWVCSRQIVVKNGSKDYYGWCSEHVFKQDEIQLWETSQVLIYLVMFNDMLQRLIANKGLRLAGIEKINMVGMPTYLGKEKLFDIYKDIQEFFEPSYKNKSMLLYGPPGTGKSSIASEIAKYKKWPLISLSPSNFIASGIDLVENKTKNLFKVLCEQRHVVVFFDEIDRLILDRDSDEYNKQGDMFQCMTPSMLVKLKALHDTPDVIFILATNYAERIDDAIIRPGRIDRQILVCPPNSELRQEIIKNLFDKQFKALSSEEIKSIADILAMGTFTDIKDYLEINKYDYQKIIANSANFAPAITMDFYSKRIEKCDKDILNREIIKNICVKLKEDEGLDQSVLNDYVKHNDKMPPSIFDEYKLIREREHEKEMNAARIIKHLMKNNDVIYVSGPITTGEEYLKCKEKSLCIDANKIKHNNIDKLDNQCIKTREKYDKFIINPSALEMGLNWSQEEFYEFWDILLSSKNISKIVFVDGWEYSVGCCYEYLSSLKNGIETEDSEFKPIKQKHAVELIENSVKRFEEVDVTKYSKLCAILNDIKKYRK